MVRGRRRAWIPLNEARPTSASLSLETGLEIMVVLDQPGHATTRITEDLFMHVRPAVHDEAAERVLKLMPGPGAEGAVVEGKSS